MRRGCFPRISQVWSGSPSSSINGTAHDRVVSARGTPRGWPIFAVSVSRRARIRHGRPLRAQQPQPPELTAPVNDFASVIEPDAGSRARRPHPQAAGGQRRRDGRRDRQDLPAVRRSRELRDRDVRRITARASAQKGKDNGLLIVLAVDDRQVRAEVGYDLEGIITDGFAGEDQPRHRWCRSSARATTAAGCVAGRDTHRAAHRRRRAASRSTAYDRRREPARRRGRRHSAGPDHLLVIIVINVVRGASARDGPRTRTPQPAVDQRRRAVRRRLRRLVGGGGWGGGGGGFGGGFGGFGGGRSGGGGGGASW